MKKTCGIKQHVKIDRRKGMSNLICCKFAIGRNYVYFLGQILQFEMLWNDSVTIESVQGLVELLEQED